MSKNAQRKAARHGERSTDADGTTLWVPPLDPALVIEASHRDALARVIAMADAGEPQNVALVGPAGSGKTSIGLWLGAVRGAPTCVEDAYGKRTPDEWFGRNHLRDGRTQYRLTQFAKLLQTPGAVVVVNDLKSAQNRTIQSGLNDILDPTTRKVYIAELEREVRVARGVVIVVTYNVGTEYTNSIELGHAIKNRLATTLWVDYPPSAVEAKIVATRAQVEVAVAARLVSYGAQMRKAGSADASTRTLIAAAQHIAHGARMIDALHVTVFGELSPDERQKALQTLVSAVDGAEVPEDMRPTAKRWKAGAL